MMYGNPYQNINPYLPKHEIVKVNGENGANAFQMAPNSSILLLDETAPIVWLAMTDGAGYKTVSAYTITPYKPEPPISTKDLLGRIEKLEAAINGKPNLANDDGSAKPANGTNKTDD